MSSNGQQRPIRVERTGVEVDEDAVLERRREDEVAWESAWSSYGNGAAMNAFDD